jgi:hypothetical protein
MRERLLVDLDVRIARHAEGDSSGVLDEQALVVVTELVASGDPDAGSLARVAALHMCRYQALPPEHGEIDLRLAQTLYTNLHTVDPRLVPADVRDFLGLASPHDTGVALMAEYERVGRIDCLERAVSLFRQEVLESQGDRANGLSCLALALLRRFERIGQRVDLDEAIELSRGAVAAVGLSDPRCAGYRAGLVGALLRRFELTAELSDVDEAVAVSREAVAASVADPTNHATDLSQLASALSRRFERTGQRADLDEATKLHRAALAAMPVDHPPSTPRDGIAEQDR